LFTQIELNPNTFPWKYSHLKYFKENDIDELLFGTRSSHKHTPASKKIGNGEDDNSTYSEPGQYSYTFVF